MVQMLGWLSAEAALASGEVGLRLAVLCDIFGEELQGNEAIEPGVFGFVNHTHAATTKFFDNAVVRDGLADHLWLIVMGDHQG
jgi:hypothetical protein